MRAYCSKYMQKQVVAIYESGSKHPALLLRFIIYILYILYCPTTEDTRHALLIVETKQHDDDTNMDLSCAHTLSTAVPPTYIYRYTRHVLLVDLLPLQKLGFTHSRRRSMPFPSPLLPRLYAQFHRNLFVKRLPTIKADQFISLSTLDLYCPYVGPSTRVSHELCMDL